MCAVYAYTVCLSSSRAPPNSHIRPGLTRGNRLHDVLNEPSCERESPLPIPQTQSAFIGTYNETLIVAALGVSNEMSRHL